MNQTAYVSPIFRGDKFTCPHCGVYALQDWVEGRPITRLYDIIIEKMMFSACLHCQKPMIWTYDYVQEVGDPGPTWRNVKVVYPIMSLAPSPVDDMPEEIKSEYMEARDIVGASPRAASALLRLCVQKLMPLLGEKGNDINDDIASLVKKGLPERIQQALDTLRVIGNSSVHPSSINLNDDRETALSLFNLLNIIVEKMITEPKRIDELYNQLPQGKRDAIAKRDTP